MDQAYSPLPDSQALTLSSTGLLFWVPPHFRQVEMGAPRPFFLRGQIDGSLQQGEGSVPRGRLPRRTQPARRRGPRAAALRPGPDEALRRARPEVLTRDR